MFFFSFFSCVDFQAHKWFKPLFSNQINTNRIRNRTIKQCNQEILFVQSPSSRSFRGAVNKCFHVSACLCVGSSVLTFNFHRLCLICSPASGYSFCSCPYQSSFLSHQMEKLLCVQLMSHLRISSLWSEQHVHFGCLGYIRVFFSESQVINISIYV